MVPLKLRWFNAPATLDANLAVVLSVFVVAFHLGPAAGRLALQNLAGLVPTALAWLGLFRLSDERRAPALFLKLDKLSPETSSLLQQV